MSCRLATQTLPLPRLNSSEVAEQVAALRQSVAPNPAHANRGPLYRLGVSSTKRIGNWTPDGKVELARLRRDFLELSGAERMKQVFELSRFMSQVADAGQRQRELGG